jgi:hypothetical protein
MTRHKIFGFLLHYIGSLNRKNPSQDRYSFSLHVSNITYIMSKLVCRRGAAICYFSSSANGNEERQADKVVRREGERKFDWPPFKESARLLIEGALFGLLLYLLGLFLFRFFDKFG